MARTCKKDALRRCSVCLLRGAKCCRDL